jgi:signal transduction histidine kinase
LPNNDAHHKVSLSQVDPFNRLSLARRLHETLAQDLAVIGYDLDALIGEEALDPSHRAQLRSIRLRIMGVTQRFRDEIYRTRQKSRSDVDREIRSMLSSLKIDIDMSYPELSEESESLLNEVLLEIARNTMKHSSATAFYLKYELTTSGFILLIGDDGVGDVNLKKKANTKENFGLRGIDELLKIIADEYVCSSDRTGTQFQIPFLLEERK